MKIKGEVQVTRLDTNSFKITVHHPKEAPIAFPRFSWPINAILHIPFESNELIEVGPFFMPNAEAWQQFTIYPRDKGDQELVGV